MGHTTCTEPQCLYKGALYLYLYLTVVVYDERRRLFILNVLESISANSKIIFLLNE